MKLKKENIVGVLNIEGKIHMSPSINNVTHINTKKSNCKLYT